MTASNPIPVILAESSNVGGVLTWSLRLKEAFARHPRYRVMLMEVGPTVVPREEFDFHVAEYTGAYDILDKMPEAIIIPNFIWPLHSVCAEFVSAGRKMRSIGVCHTHSVEEYLLPLCWYEPVIDQFVAVSRECESHLALCMPDRAGEITMLPCGVSIPPESRRDYSRLPLRLVYAGRIAQYQKRVMDFVPLVRELLRLRVDFILDIVGDGPDLAALRQAMAETPHEGRVRFVPTVQPDEMDAVWNEHDIFLQLSDFEGTSISMLEAMAHGTAPVQTDPGSGVAETLEDGENGLLVPVGDMKAMAGAIASLESDRGRLARMGEAGRRTAERFSMDRYVDAFAGVLDRAWAGPARSWPWRHPMFYPRTRQEVVLAGMAAERDRCIAELNKELAAREGRLNESARELIASRAETARYKAGLEMVLNKPPVRAWRAIRVCIERLLGKEERE